MAFTPISQADIEVGKPTKKELFQLSKDNLDDLNTRVGAIEAGNKRIIAFDEGIAGFRNPPVQNVIIWVSPYNWEISTAVLTVFTAGTSGTYEVDVIKSATPDRGLGSTIFSTKPSVAFGAGNNIQSTNAVFLTQVVSQNDYLFLDVTSFQRGVPVSFHFQMYGELA